jgi:hypothetical protein
MMSPRAQHKSLPNKRGQMPVNGISIALCTPLPLSRPLFHYNQLVRRILTIAIILVLGLPAVSPLFALTGAADPNLPACCRRDGKHHCMGMPGMLSATSSSKTHATIATLTERCPYGPHSLPGTPHPDTTLDASATFFAGILSHACVSPQTESKRRISADRSRQKRGPPSFRPA